jgi:hypothetical protein
MRELGVCKSSGRLYEGNRNSGAPVVHQSPILPIEFIGVSGPTTLKEVDGYSGIIFREESFDPITKIRRGRVYRLNESQPVTWRVQDLSRRYLEFNPSTGGVAQQLDTVGYNIDSLADLRGVKPLPKVVLGQEPFQTYWKILAIETQYDGKPLLTLKALSSFGAVPELIENQIPEQAKKLLVGRIENVEAAANKLGPIETVDACRSALSIVFGALACDLTLDLGQGIKKRLAANLLVNPKGNGQDLIIHNAEIVRRLHSRGKPSEMVDLKTRPVSDEDANLALKCLWFILVELGWAKNE